MHYKKTRKGFPMKVVLNRKEMEQAFVCYLEKKGIDVTTFDAKISVNEATITLNPETESAIVATEEMKAQVENELETTLEEAVVKQEVAFPTDSGSFGQ